MGKAFVGILGVAVIVLLIAYLTKNTVTVVSQSQKMKECIKSGGEFNVFDYSLRDDGSDYRATCEIPKHQLWEIKIK